MLRRYLTPRLSSTQVRRWFVSVNDRTTLGASAPNWNGLVKARRIKYAGSAGR